MSIKQIFISRVVVSLLIYVVWAITAVGSLMAYQGKNTFLWGALPIGIALYIALTAILFVLTSMQNNTIIRSQQYSAIEKLVQEVVDR